MCSKMPKQSATFNNLKVQKLILVSKIELY